MLSVFNLCTEYIPVRPPRGVRLRTQIGLFYSRVAAKVRGTVNRTPPALHNQGAAGLVF
jgi:hypothetical protein